MHIEALDLQIEAVQVELIGERSGAFNEERWIWLRSCQWISEMTPWTVSGAFVFGFLIARRAATALEQVAAAPAAPGAV